jgi:predicted transcriptional regulator
MTRFLETEEQKKIYYIILKNPGIHLTKIANLLTMNITIVETHLLTLEKKGVIIATNEAGYKTYTVVEQRVGSRDKRVTDTQQKIYDLIQKNQGLHLSKIAELMNMRLSLAQYHLSNLEKDHLIVSVSEKGYKRYYSDETSIGSQEKKILALLRQEIPLKIITFLIKNQTAQHKQIMEYIQVSPSTLSYHLNKLVTAEIIEVSAYGEEKGYRIRNKKEIMRCLLKYVLIESFDELWDDFSID